MGMRESLRNCVVPILWRKRGILNPKGGIGPVALTQSEWFKDQRFKDAYYYLYSAMKPATRPQKNA